MVLPKRNGHSALPPSYEQIADVVIFCKSDLWDTTSMTFFFWYDCRCKQRTISFALTLFDPHCVYIFIYYSFWIKNWCALYRRCTAQWQYKLTYCVLNFSHDSDVKFWWPPKVSDGKKENAVETQQQQPHKAAHLRGSKWVFSLLHEVALIRKMCCVFAGILIFTLWGGVGWRVILSG